MKRSIAVYAAVVRVRGAGSRRGGMARHDPSNTDATQEGYSTHTTCACTQL